jgi:signal transduction histidine kinase
MSAKRILLLLFCGVAFLCMVKAQGLPVDSVKQLLATKNKDKAYIERGLYLADLYMQRNHFDSAQLWVDSIAGNPLLQTDTGLRYTHHATQCWIYICHNFINLSIKEGEDLLKNAQASGDSFFVADAYFKLANAHFNKSNLPKTQEYCRLMAAYYPKKAPAHLYSHNPLRATSLQLMAHIYEAVENTDSLTYYANAAIAVAEKEQDEENLSQAYRLIYDANFDKTGSPILLKTIQQIKELAATTADSEIKLVMYKCLLDAAVRQDDYAVAHHYAREGIRLIKADRTIDVFNIQHFLFDAIALLKPKGNKEVVIALLDMQTYFYLRYLSTNQRQISVIQSAIQLKENRALQLEVEAARNTRRINALTVIIIIAAALLLIIALLWLLYSQKQKLKRVQFLSKISQDLHDDIGASLSSIQIYSAVAQQTFESNPAKSLEMMGKINNQSKEIMEDMSDIVWSMKAPNETEDGIAIKIKNFWASLLGDTNINFTCQVAPNTDALVKSATARRNILLITKEATNNLVKYSRATEAALHLYTEGHTLYLQIADNGVGFNNSATPRGNGLNNMQQRTLELKGKFEIITAANSGTTIKIQVPLSSLH